MPDRRLTEDEAAAVFRRAAELDDQRSPDERGLDRVAIERAAMEVGLAPASVHQALAELDAGRLMVEHRPAWHWRDQVATVERHIDVSPDRVRSQLETFLRRQTLRVARRRGDVSVWEQATGLGPRLLRRTDLAGRLRLHDVTHVSLCVTGDGRGATARIDLDFTRTRAANRAGALAGGVLGTGLAVAGVFGALVGPDVLLVAVPAGAALGGGTWFGARSNYSTTVGQAVGAVELALDEIENR